ncbi:hypothetical protein [Pseudoxanthomonas taiwanensis]|jgi:hypothetical protein|uniref:Uncharacterized protein n=1 Tax=Pseudoxanthomonas taiwanensis TaxID=176598 RepID=A0A921NYA2_9GAMM|nr:hypothetical protein [Pseudoxanthomonas taiwanensis]KAF1690799.1 hypothetical protein CR938_00780 [Pseudoxanthomonas taiwanensis]
MTANTSRFFLLSVLALLMAASRAHVFDHFSPPDATWAVFFVGGFLLRGWGRAVFPLLMALAMGIDWVVISSHSMAFWDHYCVSAAYWGLIPAYGLLWMGGSWLRRHYRGADLAAAGRLLAAFLVAVTACQLVAQGTFYWYSGVVAEPTLAGWWQNFLDWLPGYMGTAAGYTAIAAVLQVAAERVAPLLRAARAAQH